MVVGVLKTQSSAKRKRITNKFMEIFDHSFMPTTPIYFRRAACTRGPIMVRGNVKTGKRNMQLNFKTAKDECVGETNTVKRALNANNNCYLRHNRAGSVNQHF